CLDTRALHDALPISGVLAIAVHTAGSLGKLFAEVNENVDPRPIEGIRAAGGNWPMLMRLGVVPQALPNYASYLLLRFEINVRGADRKSTRLNSSHVK